VRISANYPCTYWFQYAIHKLIKIALSVKLMRLMLLLLLLVVGGSYIDDVGATPAPHCRAGADFYYVRATPSGERASEWSLAALTCG